MKLRKFLLLVVTVGCLNQLSAQNLNIIPEPFHVAKGTGVFQFPKSIAIDAPSSANEVADQIAKQLKTVTGRTISFTKNAPSITLDIIKDDVIGNEGYTLNINATGIVISANTNAGLFYGWQTVQQILPAAIYANKMQNNIQWQLPYVSIIDKPRFGWRGMMLDVSRHFFSKADVKVFIDDMARYKYNRFHWHLTDDQGWRIEIKSLPKLTSVGAWRAERKGKWMNITTPGINEPKTYGGFYTQEDIKEVVAYAKSKFIEVIPEIDVPGHSMAMNTAYPELSTTPNYPYQVNAGDEFMDWEGMNGHPTAMIDNSLDPSNEKVYEYLDKIMGEIAPLFPYEYIHMGWDEILQGGLTGDAVVMSWQGTKGGIEAAKQGHKVVMSPNDYNYIDYYQGEVTAEGKVYRGLRMKTTYGFEPVPAGIDPSLILGNQANQWTEQLQTMRKVQYMTWPRGMAVAETSWSPAEKKNWNSFAKKVESQFEKLDAADVIYARSMYDPIVTTQLNTKGEYIVKMEGEVDGLSIYYTIDDQMPNQYSDLYTTPFVLPEDVLSVRIITYRDGKQIGKFLNIPMASLKSRAKKIL